MEKWFSQKQRDRIYKHAEWTYLSIESFCAPCYTQEKHKE